MPDLGQQPREHAVGDRLGVDQHPVAVEDDGARLADADGRAVSRRGSACGTRPAPSRGSGSARRGAPRGRPSIQRLASRRCTTARPLLSTGSTRPRSTPIVWARSHAAEPNGSVPPVGRARDSRAAAPRRCVIEVKNAHVSNSPRRARSWPPVTRVRPRRADHVGLHDPRRAAAAHDLDAAERALDERAELARRPARASSGSGPSGGAGRRRRRDRRRTSATAAARCPAACSRRPRCARPRWRRSR